MVNDKVAADTMEVMHGITSALDMKPLVVEKRPMESEPLSTLPCAAPEHELTEHEKQADADFKAARDNLNAIISAGLNAISEITTIASQTQKPYAYDTVSRLIKEVAEANQNLMMLHQNRRDLVPDKDTVNAGPVGISANNVLIVNSPKDLLDIVRHAIDK